jgi:tellurite resistance protein
MTNDNKESRIDIGQVVKDLAKIVVSDESITGEEHRMLDSMDDYFLKYTQEYIKAVADKIITPEENKQLKTIWENLYEKSEQIAMKDGVISPDEKNILLRIAKELSKDK